MKTGTYLVIEKLPRGALTLCPYSLAVVERRLVPLSIRKTKTPQMFFCRLYEIY